MAHLAEVERACEKLIAYRDCLRVTGGKQTVQADWDELEFLEALQLAFDLVENDRFFDHLENLRSDLGIDEDGYRIGPEGDATDWRVHVPPVPVGRAAA